MERRRHSRFEVVAQVQVACGGQEHLLSASNLSAGGVFVEATPQAFPQLQLGTPVKTTVFDNTADQWSDINARAKVVRIQQPLDYRPGGFGLMFTQIDEASQSRLTGMLERVVEAATD